MRPNIVLINCDDLGYGDLGCYGSTLNRTPAIDRMAAEGARFSDFYAAAPVCSPSRAAMLTGSYPTRVGFGGKASGGLGGVLFPGWSIGLNPSEITIARLLADAGYTTKLVGKWHCGDQPAFLPTAHGFDEYYGLPYSNDMGRQVDPPGGATMRMEDLEKAVRELGCEEAWIRPPLPLLEGERVLEAQPDQAALTGRYLEQAIRFIRKHSVGTSAGDKPFFLYLAHMYVHLPIYVQERFRKASKNGDYGAAVECIDWVTEVILAELVTLGIDEQTMVIFTSDNGALAVEKGGSGSNGPLRGSKGQTWEGGQRVPCIVRWPGRVPAGLEVSSIAANIDLYPTIAAACGERPPSDRVIDGRDLSPDLGLCEQDGHEPHQFLYISRACIEAIRVGRWKLHRSKRAGELALLFDLEADIGETNDVASSNPDVVADLTRRIDRAMVTLGDERSGIVGSEVRPIGKVDDPVPLAEYDPDHPYFMAEYDLADRG